MQSRSYHTPHNWNKYKVLTTACRIMCDPAPTDLADFITFSPCLWVPYTWVFLFLESSPFHLGNHPSTWVCLPPPWLSTSAVLPQRGLPRPRDLPGSLSSTPSPPVHYRSSPITFHLLTPFSALITA